MSLRVRLGRDRNGDTNGSGPTSGDEPGEEAPDTAVLPPAGDDTATEDAPEDAIAEHASTDDAAGDDAPAEHASTDDAPEDAIAENASTDDTLTEDAIAENASTNDTATEDASTDDTATEDAGGEDASTEEAHIGDAYRIADVEDGANGHEPPQVDDDHDASVENGLATEDGGDEPTADTEPVDDAGSTSGASDDDLDQDATELPADDPQLPADDTGPTETDTEASAQAAGADGVDEIGAEQPGTAAQSPAETEAETDPDGGEPADIDALIAELVDPVGDGEPVATVASHHPAPTAETSAPPTTDREPAVRAAQTTTEAGPLALRRVLRPALIVLLIAGAAGFGIGWSRGGEEVVRREFVYTLDESVPDSFLREDRRLLTQIATLQSDAVLTPVAETHGLTVAELRGKIDLETVDLSEVLRLEVTDRDRERAEAISDAVLSEYLVVTTSPLPSASSQALLDRRDEALAELTATDARLLAIEEEGARLQTAEESLQRSIDRENERINRLQGIVDESLTTAGASGRATLEAELDEARTELADLEGQLAQVRTDRADLGGRDGGEAALAREVARLEADLATIDAELAERDLGPVVSSPVRLLSEPTYSTRTPLQRAAQGAALGLLIAAPVAAALALRARNRQLWLG